VNFVKMMANDMKNDSFSKRVITNSCISLTFLVLITMGLSVIANTSTFSSWPLHLFLLLGLGFLYLILMILFVANLFLIAISPKKKAHLAMFVLIPAVTINAYQFGHKLENYGHHRWFLNSALTEYQTAVNIMLRDPSIITNQERLQILVGLPTGCSCIHGEIKPDGSIGIYFAGTDHWSGGHVYFSGGQTNFDDYHYLTNNWYEY
jgi:hypothetical protein